MVVFFHPFPLVVMFRSPGRGKFQPAEDKGVHYFFRQLKTAALPNFCKGQAGTSSVVALLETNIISILFWRDFWVDDFPCPHLG